MIIATNWPEGPIGAGGWSYSGNVTTQQSIDEDCSCFYCLYVDIVSWFFLWKRPCQEFAMKEPVGDMCILYNGTMNNLLRGLSWLFEYVSMTVEWIVHVFVPKTGFIDYWLKFVLFRYDMLRWPLKLANKGPFRRTKNHGYCTLSKLLETHFRPQKK